MMPIDQIKSELFLARRISLRLDVEGYRITASNGDTQTFETLKEAYEAALAIPVPVLPTRLIKGKPWRLRNPSTYYKATITRHNRRVRMRTLRRTNGAPVPKTSDKDDL